MYYLGGPPPLEEGKTDSGAKDLDREVPNHAAGSAIYEPQSSTRKIMAWDDESNNLSQKDLKEVRQLPPLGSQQSLHSRSSERVRFEDNIPSRASERMASILLSPPGIENFEISSEGDVSPFSLNTKLSPTSATAAESSTQISKPDRDNSPTEDAFHEQDLIGPVPRQMTRLPSKVGRPTLSLIIPVSNRPPPVEKFCLSADSDSASSPASAKTTPIVTPAHCRRLPSQAGTRAAKTPKKVSLREELRAVGVVFSGSAKDVSASERNISVHDFAHEKSTETWPPT
ncbi:MAG: hypothetical protein Q9201_002096 [Fulgogasparrea decipioides]